jgi:hypothetical protein
VHELASLDEAFISSSTREIVPAMRVGMLEIGHGRPGPVTRTLQAAFRRFAEREARRAIDDPPATRGTAGCATPDAPKADADAALRP